MQSILYWVENCSWFPQEHHFLIAQILSALAFVVILFASARFATWLCNHHISSVLKIFKAQRWFDALKATHFFIALGVVVAAIVAVNLYPVFISKEASWVN